LEAKGDVAGARAAYESALALDPKLEEAKVGRARLK
jgi:cytochrome c-type biogenesis protein CcmH/NrfG